MEAVLVALRHYVALVIEAMAISLTWDEIGRLAAIAAIRTFPNLFLERDMGDGRERIREGRVPASAK